MTTSSAAMQDTHAQAAARRFPPVAQLGTASLALVIVGGIVMASAFPSPPQLLLPIVLLCASAAISMLAIALLLRQPRFAWTTFFVVARWALLAYAISAGMIEYAFIRNHVAGAPLLVVSLMLVMFALDVPLIIAYTVARYR